VLSMDNVITSASISRCHQPHPTPLPDSLVGVHLVPVHGRTPPPPRLPPRDTDGGHRHQTALLRPCPSPPPPIPAREPLPLQPLSPVVLPPSSSDSSLAALDHQRRSVPPPPVVLHSRQQHQRPPVTAPAPSSTLTTLHRVTPAVVDDAVVPAAVQPGLDRIVPLSHWPLRGVVVDKPLSAVGGGLSSARHTATSASITSRTLDVDRHHHCPSPHSHPHPSHVVPSSLGLVTSTALFVTSSTAKPSSQTAGNEYVDAPTQRRIPATVAGGGSSGPEVASSSAMVNRHGGGGSGNLVSGSGLQNLSVTECHHHMTLPTVVVTQPSSTLPPPKFQQQQQHHRPDALHPVNQSSGPVGGEKCGVGAVNGGGNSCRGGGGGLRCSRCGRCRCASCTAPRDLPRHWIGNFECSVQRCVSVTSCVCCVEALFYHFLDGSNADGGCGDSAATDEPCACCERPRCCLRWTLIGALATTVLPCLWCYCPLTCAADALTSCYNACSASRGCRCGGQDGSGSSAAQEASSSGASTRGLLAESESSST
jgi:hypothetical protein